MAETIRINRAAVVAERLGFDRDTARTLGQAVAGLSAYANGVSLGIIEPQPDLVHERGQQWQAPEGCYSYGGSSP